MTEIDENEGGIDYAALMQGVAETREAVGAMVNGLVADGFTDEQARKIVAGFFRVTGRSEE